MKRFGRSTILGILAVALVAITPVGAQDAAAPAPADTAAAAPAAGSVANNTAFGSWVFNCDAVAVNKTECRLVQELSRRETRELVVRFLVLPAADDTFLLLAQVPIGAYLPKGAVYRFADDEATEQRTMIWQRCLGEICEAAIALDEAEKALFLDREALLFAYQPEITGEPVVVRVSLENFKEGLDALATAR